MITLETWTVVKMLNDSKAFFEREQSWIVGFHDRKPWHGLFVYKFFLCNEAVPPLSLVQGTRRELQNNAGLNKDISHTIHVWFIYLHLPYFAIKNNQM